VDLKKLLFNKGPVYWGVLVPDNGLCTWLSALGGLYNGSLSTNNNRGHALVITGWGWSSINGKYWIVRNSWGSSLIDNGYVYIPMKEPGYYPTGSNKAGKLIYKNLYTAYIRRPDCNSSKININIIGGPAYLPNNISIVQFTVQVYIEDPENFDISFKIISDSKYLLENNIVNSENFVVEKDKKVTDNVTNYYCTIDKNVDKCIIKKWFVYDMDIKIPNLLINDLWKIEIKVTDKTQTSDKTEIKKEKIINWSSRINIQIIYINLLTGIIGYKIIKDIESTSLIETSFGLGRIKKANQYDVFDDDVVMIYTKTIDNNLEKYDVIQTIMLDNLTSGI